MLGHLEKELDISIQWGYFILINWGEILSAREKLTTAITIQFIKH